MLVALALAALALRSGLEVRRRRREGRGAGAALRERHLRRSKSAVALLVVGLASGPLSAYFLRHWQPFETLHGAVAAAAVSLFLATAWFGRLLERGEDAVRERHARLALVAALAAGLTFATGFVLLP